MSVADEIEWTEVEVARGRPLDERGFRWFVSPTDTHGSQMFGVSDYSSFADAMVDALSFGVPVRCAA